MGKKENVNVQEDINENVDEEVVKNESDAICEDAVDSENPEETLENASCEAENEAQPDEKKVKKDKKDEKIEELEDRVRRQMAEFENFRKRTDKEKSSMYEMGAKSVIEKILPIVDNFERGLQAVPEDQKDSAVAQGMQMIYKQIMTEFESMGVKAIETVGQEFNPELHNAVMQVESDEYESGVIAQELQKGYTYRDSVVRHSMVAVVQ